MLLRWESRKTNQGLRVNLFWSPFSLSRCGVCVVRAVRCSVPSRKQIVAKTRAECGIRLLTCAMHVLSAISSQSSPIGLLKSSAYVHIVASTDNRRPLGGWRARANKPLRYRLAKKKLGSAIGQLRTRQSPKTWSSQAKLRTQPLPRYQHLPAASSQCLERPAQHPLGRPLISIQQACLRERTESPAGCQYPADNGMEPC